MAATEDFSTERVGDLGPLIHVLRRNRDTDAADQGDAEHVEPAELVVEGGVDEPCGQPGGAEVRRGCPGRAPALVPRRWGRSASRPARSVRPVGAQCRPRCRRSRWCVVRVEGYFVDLTRVRREETEAELQTALARVVAHREAIDEAKGMVMIATGCSSEAAFACLRRYSRTANLKLQGIAHRLVGSIGPDNRGAN